MFFLPYSTFDLLSSLVGLVRLKHEQWIGKDKNLRVGQSETEYGQSEAVQGVPWQEKKCDP